MDVLRIMNGSVSRRTALVLAAAALAVPDPGRAGTGPEAAATAEATDPSARDLVGAAQSRLAFNLLEKVARGDGEAATVSPASLAAALELLSIGADQPMKAAIARVLGFDKHGGGLEALADVRSRLEGGGDSFSFADKLVFSPSHPPGKLMLPGLKELHIPYEIVDLSTPEGARKIDDWVKEVTKGRIPEILGGPLPSGSLAALNALHFKSRWKTPFDPEQTRQTAFTGLDGKSGDVAMMHLAGSTRLFRQKTVATGAGRHRSEREFVAIDLPFADERFSLVVATTTGKPASIGDFAPVAEWLSGKGFAAHSGDLALPRFAAASREDLLRAVDGLGLEKARTQPGALAGFGPDVVLSQVTQRTMIEVTEEGAEAAAATVATGVRSLVTGDTAIHMVVDKPFVYALRDTATGVILIAGYVGRAPKGTS